MTRTNDKTTQVTNTTRLHTIAMLGNHLPRQCGIATFTTDLSEAISAEFSALECFVLAMNDAGHRYAYPPRVRFEIAETDIASYRRAADFLNVNTVDVLCVQHEYGIFGGKAGSHVLALLRELRMPIVTTLHTILGRAESPARAAMDELPQLSERLVVMSDAWGVAAARSPRRAAGEDRPDSARHPQPSGRRREQGPARRRGQVRDPHVRAAVAGQGHRARHRRAAGDPRRAIRRRSTSCSAPRIPHVKERHGETYRLMLENRAASLGVDPNIIFHNRFVSQAELTKFLSAADIYITPYLKPDQITSGTLAYAVGSGKAVISTPYSYARELLADGRGILVPWPRDDPEAIAREVIGLLDDPCKADALRERAAASGKGMLWPASRVPTWTASSARARSMPTACARCSRPRRSPRGRWSCPNSTWSTLASS